MYYRAVCERTITVSVIIEINFIQVNLTGEQRAEKLASYVEVTGVLCILKQTI